MTRPASISKFQSALLSVLCLTSVTVMSQVNVTTYHNDNSRTGQNAKETVLTPALLSSGGFGKLFSVFLDGQVYAQPLVLSNVKIAGTAKNIVYVATEHDSLYAIDAGNGTVYWKRSFISPPNVTSAHSGSAGINCPSINPEYGITSTPVIGTASGTIYVVPQTQELGNYVYRLHAVDVATGSDKLAPVQIEASLNGETFDAGQQLNRPALLLENGHIILAWGSFCDHAPYYGWVMSYNATTLAQEAVFNVNSQPDSSGENAGIWMSGAGVASDADGNLYFATGNGDFGSLFPLDYGSSILKLSPPGNGTFSIVDWFTPYTQSAMNNPNDEDLGSGGVLLIPTQSAGVAHPNLLVQMGKDGVLHLVDRNNMGQYCSTCTTSDTNIVQEIPQASMGVWGAPAYWKGRVYFGSGGEGGADHVKAFSLYSTVPQLKFDSQTPQIFSYPTPTPSVSSNGNTNGILWVVDDRKYFSSGPAYLHAYDATNLNTRLYTTTANACRDQMPKGVKFTVPTVANGKVYVGGAKTLTVLGQLTSSSVAPSLLDFGSHHSTDASQQLNTTLTNTGTQMLFLGIGQLAAPFALNATTCGAMLAPGSSCTITVQFSPSQGQTGSNSQTLVIDDSAVSGCQKITLTASIS